MIELLGLDSMVVALWVAVIPALIIALGELVVALIRHNSDRSRLLEHMILGGALGALGGLGLLLFVEFGFIIYTTMSPVMRVLLLLTGLVLAVGGVVQYTHNKSVRGDS